MNTFNHRVHRNFDNFFPSPSSRLPCSGNFVTAILISGHQDGCELFFAPSWLGIHGRNFCVGSHDDDDAAQATGARYTATRGRERG
jgi:hypothetical protein